MNLEKLKNKLRDLSLSNGAELFGVCRIEDLRQQFHPEVKDMAKRLETGISVGIPLSHAVMETIVDRPNMLYKAHYQQANHTLNDIAFLLARKLKKVNHEAIPIPASQLLAWDPMRAHLSHREIAFKAGLGWWGRNNLLVCADHGAKIRLVTVLTDAPLPADKPSTDDCGGCTECLGVCPADAISEDREHFDLNACHEKIVEFSKHNNYGHLICGICLKACCGGE